ncbi:MAG: arginase family protein [Pseudomonadota bacterium]|nr:arginase family protein [Pseudomonadota bacterium]
MPISLLGFCWDASSSHARGPALAPPLVMAMLDTDISSDYSLSGLRLSDVLADRVTPKLSREGEAARGQIAETVAAAIDAGNRPLSLGGDHSVTFPILRSIFAAHGPVNLLHIDAHQDMYDAYEGDPFSHASPFARAMEAGFIGEFVQVGIRSTVPSIRDSARERGIIVLGAEEWREIPYDRLKAPLYVSIDLDGLDPAFAPGVSHPEPGGLSTREVLSILTKLETPPVGADIVELNPEKDVNLLTAHVAVRLIKELAALMTSGG